MPDQTLQEIRDRLNIAEVIGGYIQIKKAGSNFKAVCPFHSEKTPSLMISPSKQIWHCFGCGEGGDVFTFVMRYENLEFREALRILADKAGVQLPAFRPVDKKIEDEKELLLKINNFAARFYHQILIADKRGKEALIYLENRGLKPETIKQWQIGFAPPDFHILEKALAQKNIKLDNLIKAGVSVKNEKGQNYDRFRSRITFPIFNYYGEIVGFSARIFPEDDKQAKYINSPETLIYNKSKILFGLNFAKTEIRKKDEAVIVEGQMDCITAHQAGFVNVVASSGTALTEGHLNVLSRLTKNLKFCFDADSAGLIATKKAVERYLGTDFVIKIVNLKGAKDPDELIKKDSKGFEQAVTEAPLFLDYYFKKAFESFSPDSVEQKKQIAKEILPLLRYLNDPLELEHYLKLLAEKLQTSERALWDKLMTLKDTFSSFHPAKEKPSIAAKISQGKTDALEKEILGGILLFPDFLNFASSMIKIEDFENAEISRIVEHLFKQVESIGDNQPAPKSIDPSPPGVDGADPSQANLKKIAERNIEESVVAKEAQFMVESLLHDLENDEEVLKRQLKRSLAVLRLNGVKKQQQKLQLKIKFAESTQDRAKLEQLKQEFAKLAEVRTDLEKTL